MSLRDAQGEERAINLNPEHLQVITEGMRRTVIQEGGTARALERDDVADCRKIRNRRTW
jgi:cell division protein FtsI/penicillin-binding protein 2